MRRSSSRQTALRVSDESFGALALCSTNDGYAMARATEDLGCPLASHLRDPSPLPRLLVSGVYNAGHVPLSIESDIFPFRPHSIPLSPHFTGPFRLTPLFLLTPLLLLTPHISSYLRVARDKPLLHYHLPIIDTSISRLAEVDVWPCGTSGCTLLNGSEGLPSLSLARLPQSPERRQLFLHRRSRDEEDPSPYQGGNDGRQVGQGGRNHAGHEAPSGLRGSPEVTPRTATITPHSCSATSRSCCGGLEGNSAL